MSLVQCKPSRKNRRFVLRAIKSGSVRIYGRKYKPELDASKFNGMVAAFALYWWNGLWDDKFVSLWGSERAYKSKEGEMGERMEDFPGPFCEDGVFLWEWWNKVEDKVEENEG